MIYIGGLKIWECSVDLAEYLIDQSIPVSDVDVIEVACSLFITNVHVVASHKI